MESFAVFLVLIPVALIALPIVAIVTSNSRATQLRGEMADLINRLRYLEARLESLAQRAGAQGEAPPQVPAQAAQPAAVPPVAPVAPATRPAEAAFRQRPRRHLPLRFAAPAAPSAPQFPVAAPQFRSLEPAPAGDSRSLESRIGSQWFNRIGILAVLIGVAWFLKLAFDNHWIGPLGRVIIGLLAGAALIVWSSAFKSAGTRFFPIR